MNKLILAVIIFASCGGGGSSSAEPCGGKECAIGVKVIHIQSELSFELKDAIEATKEAINYLNLNTTLKFKYVDAISLKDFNSKDATLDNFKNDARFREYSNFLYDNRGVGANASNREITLFIDRPLTQNGVVYTAGQAHICSLYDRGKLGIVYATYFTNPNPNSSSFKRPFSEMFNRMVYVIAHEILHLAGSYHRHDCMLCLMLPSGGLESYGSLFQFIVNGVSINESEKCVRRSIRIKLNFCSRRTNKLRRLRRCKNRFNIRRLRKRDVRYPSELREFLAQDNVISEIFGD